MKIITSNPGNKPVSWPGYRAINVLNEGEDGDGVHVPTSKARLFPGRYGPPVSAMLELTRVDGGIFVNSDIELTTPGLRQFIVSSPVADSRVVTYARRIETPSFKLNPWGIDVLIVGPSFYRDLNEHSGWQALQFGAPWWDVVLPTAAALMGYTVQRIDAPVAFHCTHTQRWSRLDWRIAGEYARAFLVDLALRKGVTDFPAHKDLHEFHFAMRAWRDARTASVQMLVAPSIIQDAMWRFANRGVVVKKKSAWVRFKRKIGL